jgi:thiol-disulfide isomerase/thioredoxin
VNNKKNNRNNTKKNIRNNNKIEIRSKKNKFIDSIESFFSSKFNIALIFLILILGVFAFFQGPSSINNNVEIDSSKPAVYFFFTPTCPYCNQQKPIYYDIKEERQDVNFFEYDASSQEGSALFYKMATESGLDKSRLGVPAIFVGKNALIGLQSRENIISAIDECINQCKDDKYVSEEQQDIKEGFQNFELPFFGRVDLTKWSLPFLTIILGLIDGFNPCALWVLIFLITMLMGEKSKKKIWLVVGSFVFASAVSYFLFMTAWLNLFLVMGYVRFITLLIGLFAVGTGILHVREWITTKGDLSCKVGDEKSHEKTMDKIQNIISKPVTIGVLISVIGLAFVVNAIEFVCSAAIPAVYTQVLALSNLSWIQHYSYIALYVFFYMLDHIIIFGMAAFALGSGFMNKYAKYCKLIGGIVMFAIGIMLLFAPHLLA